MSVRAGCDAAEKDLVTYGLNAAVLSKSLLTIAVPLLSEEEHFLLENILNIIKYSKQIKYSNRSHAS